MDSQGRSRLIVGALTLAAVILVISLLVSQQGGRVPVAVESPLATGVATEIVNEVREGDDAEQAPSPLAVGGPESPLASPDSEMGATAAVTDSVSVTDTVSVSDTVSVTNTVSITDTDSITNSIGITATTQAVSPSVSAQSTVTVTLVASQPRRYGVEVVATYPHDPEAYTQGLQYVDGVLYEGTGLYGRSSLRRVDLESGTVEQQVNLADQYFGEGIYVLEDRIYQLTWQSRVAFLYDRESFEVVNEFSYPTEGWGLTFDGEQLIMSDGSATLFWRDPATFAEVGRVGVHEVGEPVNLLNELEYIDGEVWANVWQTDEIVLIEPESGRVMGRANFAGLLSADEAEDAEVLNGIAYDAENDRIFVTGKFWPKLFEVKLVPR